MYLIVICFKDDYVDTYNDVIDKQMNWLTTELS